MKKNLSSPSLQRKKSEEKKTKKVAIYIRVSSEEQAKAGYSPETQEEKLKEFIKNNGWQLNERHIYKDIGHSGGTDKRPDFQRFMGDARNKEFDIVIVYRLDRFFRNLRLLLNTLEELKTLGVDFKSATESFDTSTISGEVTLTALGMAADLVRKITDGSRVEGSLKALRDGKWTTGGLMPYGFKINRKTHKLEIHKREAKIVKMIFEFIAYKKLSKYKVQQRLNGLKIPTKYDSSKKTKLKKVNSFGFWHVRTIDRILKNKLYTGECYYRKYEYYKDSQGKKRKKLRPEKEWIKFKVPAIVSKELYEVAQRQLSKNSKISPRNAKRKYAFRHKLYCGIDGWKYYVFYRKPRKPTYSGVNFYRCSGKNRYIHAKLCPSKQISENRILPPVWKKLKELLADPEVVMEKFNKYSYIKSKRKIIKESLIKIEKNLQVIQKKKERAFKQHVAGRVKDKLYEKTWNELEEQEIHWEREKERFSQFLVKEDEKKSRVASIHELYEKLKDAIKNATYDTKCEIIDKIIERITINGQELEIECNLPIIPQGDSIKSSINGQNFSHDNRFTECHGKTFKVFLKTQLRPITEITKHQNRGSKCSHEPAISTITLKRSG